MAVAMLLLLSVVTACAPQRSSRLSIGDVDAIVAQTKQSLTASRFIQSRSPASPPIVLSVQKVENLTSDVITESEQWAMMVEISNDVFVRSPLGRNANIKLIVPRERLTMARRRGVVPAFESADELPTHIMTATFRSVTRDNAAQRYDEYYCEYQITELLSREIVWSDRVKLTRKAFGRAFN